MISEVLEISEVSEVSEVSDSEVSEVPLSRYLRASEFQNLFMSLISFDPKIEICSSMILKHCVRLSPTILLFFHIIKRTKNQ